jgi:sugar phosphate isomerase/epimerase
MVKFGNLTNPTKNILEEIKLIKRLRFDFVEISIEWPENRPAALNRKRKQILGLLKKHKLFAIAHTAWWMDFSSPYEAIRRGWIEEAKKKIDMAHNLGINKINFHTYSKSIKPFYKKYKSTILNNFIKSLKDLILYAKSKDMKVILENGVEKGEIVDLKDFRIIMHRIPDVKFHLDVGHAFVHGGMKNIKNFIFSFKSRLEHVHMSDNHGESDEHLPIGNGFIDFVKVIEYLKKIGYDKTITCEIFTKNRMDARNSMLEVKRLWNKS